MAKKSEPTKEQVIEDFKSLSLEDQVYVFKEERDILEAKSIHKQNEIKLLQSIDNEKK